MRGGGGGGVVGSAAAGERRVQQAFTVFIVLKKTQSVEEKEAREEERAAAGGAGGAEEAMVNEHLTMNTPINSIHLETLGHSGSDSEVKMFAVEWSLWLCCCVVFPLLIQLSDVIRGQIFK